MANLWAGFAELVQGNPTLIGTVLSHTADGYSMVEMPGGGIVKAKGVLVAVNNKAFIKNEEVTGEAPELQLFEVSV